MRITFTHILFVCMASIVATGCKQNNQQPSWDVAAGRYEIPDHKTIFTLPEPDKLQIAHHEDLPENMTFLCLYPDIMLCISAYAFDEPRQFQYQEATEYPTKLLHDMIDKISAQEYAIADVVSDEPILTPSKFQDMPAIFFETMVHISPKDTTSDTATLNVKYNGYIFTHCDHPNAIVATRPEGRQSAKADSISSVIFKSVKLF